MFAFLSINGWFCRYFLILELSMSWNPCLKFWLRNTLHFPHTCLSTGKVYVTSFRWKSEWDILLFSNTVVETITDITFWRNTRQSAFEVTRIIEHPVHMQVLHHNPTWPTLRFLSARGIRGSEKALAFLKDKNTTSAQLLLQSSHPQFCGLENMQYAIYNFRHIVPSRF